MDGEEGGRPGVDSNGEAGYGGARAPGGAGGNGPEAGATPGEGGAAGDAAGGARNEAGATNAPAPLIDDFEDHDNRIELLEGRDGYWFTALDPYGSTIEPEPNDTGLAPLIPGTTNCHAGSTACLAFSGTTVAADEPNAIYPYATVGFAFRNQSDFHPYDASAYSGIKLWARGDVPVRINVNTAATTDVNGGGTCVYQCGDAHGLSVVLDSSWREITLPFASIAQQEWGTTVGFDPAQLLGVTVLLPAGVTFEGAIDDVTLY